MNDKVNKVEGHEWSYLMNADEVVQKTLKLKISPDAQQKKALCKRLGIDSIDKLEAELEISRNRGNMIIYIHGRLSALIRQRCIVSLEPVKETVEEEFEGWFSDPSQAVSFAKAKRDRLSIQEQMEQPVLGEEDDPEPIVDGKIDLGEFVTQHFSLAINPYPKAEGVEYGNVAGHAGQALDEVYDNPFAALKEWKAKEQKKDKQ